MGGVESGPSVINESVVAGLLDAFDASFPRASLAGSGGRYWLRFGGGIGGLRGVGDYESGEDEGE